MANSLLGTVKAGGPGYMKPNISPEVVKLLAEMGFAPDGSRVLGSAFDGLSTPQRLDALDKRISSDWQGMGFEPSMPTQDMADPRAQYVGNNTDIFMGANSPMANTGPDPFGQETRQRVAGINQRIDADMAAMEAPQMPAEAPRGSPAPWDATSIPYGHYGAGDTVSSTFPPTPMQPPAAPPMQPPPPKPTPRPRPTTYVVRAGDNPTTIARKLGMPLSKLAAKNPGLLKNARRLKIGSSLKV
jgi:hypothetical protein